MGVVYLGEDPRLGRLVALKTMSSSVADDAELLERFYREAQSAGKLHHPNIVTIYDIDEADGVPFIAMEFLEGETLEKIISSRRDLPILKKLDIVIQVCKGLDYAHKHGIVHRDVKCGNIVVKNDGIVKIVDFGIARVIQSAAMTRAGVVMGTPMYMAPEHIKGLAVDHRADLFSIGVILYEILTYKNPFMAPDTSAILFKIAAEDPPPLSSLLSHCPPELERIVRHALEKDKEKRYQSGEDFAFDLERIADVYKREMFEVYVDEGQRSFEEGDYEQAKESLKKVLEIDSNHNIALHLLAKVKEQMLAIQNRRRIEEILPGARDFLDSGQNDEAIGLFDEILSLDPDHVEARESKQKASEARARKLQSSQQMEIAGNLAEKGDLQGTKAQLEEVLALDPQHTSALALMSWVSGELAEQERQRSVRKLIAGARARSDAKEYVQALELLEKARQLDTLNIEVESLTRMVKSDHEKAARRKILEGRLAQIQQALDQEEFERGLALAEQAAQEFPSDQRVKDIHSQAARLAEIQRKRSYVDEELRVARTHFLKDQYAEAVEVLRRALETAPEDIGLLSFLKTVEEAQERGRLESVRLQVFREASELIRSANFVLAIETVERGLTRAGDSPELTGLLQLAREQQAAHQRQEQIRDVLNRAQALLREERYEEAILILEEHDEQLKADEISALLKTAKGQLQQSITRRDTTVARARKMLEGGEAAKALELLELAPKAYLAHASFKQVYEDCRESVARARSVRSTAAEIEESIKKKNLGQAEKLLQQALQTHGDEPVLLDVQKRLRDEQFRAQQAEWLRQLEKAQAAMKENNYPRAVEILNSLPAEIAQVPALFSQAQALQTKVAEEEARRAEELARQSREVEIKGISEEAQALAKDRNFDQSLHVLEAALKNYPGESRLKELQRATMAAKASHERGKAVKEIVRRGQELSRQNRLREGLQLAQVSLQQFAGEAALLDLQKQLEKQEANARKQALNDLRKLDREIRETADGAEQEGLFKLASTLSGQWPEDKEIRSMASSLAQFRADRRIPKRPEAPHEKTVPYKSPRASAGGRGGESEVDITIVSPPRLTPARASSSEAIPRTAPPQQSAQPIPSRQWLWIALAAFVVLGGATGFLFYSRRQTPTPVTPASLVEIVTTPEGARIRVNNQECVTPNCRLNLPSGTYELEAQLPGYQAQVKSFTVDVAKPEASASIRIMMLPIPAPPPALEAGGAATPAIHQGTLVVEAGVPGVDVFLNDKRYGVTTNKGELRVPLEENEYAVAVAKSGYEASAPRRVRVRSALETKIQFNLTPVPQFATLSIQNALADAKVSLDGQPVGVVQRDGNFSISVGPGDHSIDLTKEQYKPIRIQKTFTPGKTVTIGRGEVEQTLIAQPQPAPPKPAPVVVDQQLEDWKRVSGSDDPRALEDFRRKYPSGPHAEQAAKRIEQLEWDSVKNSKDMAALRAFAAKYPAGPFTHLAQGQIQALQPPPPAVAVQAPPERQAILEAIRRYSTAVQRKELGEALAVWPTLTKKEQSRLRDSFRQFRSIRMDFQPSGDPQVSGDTARLACARVVESVDDQGPHTSRSNVMVGFRKTAGEWKIESIE